MKCIPVLIFLMTMPAAAQFSAPKGGGGGSFPGLIGGLSEATVDAPSLPNGECVDVPSTVPGVKTGDYVSAQAQCDLPPSVFIDGALVTSDEAVAVRICNISTSGTENPAPCLFQFFYVRATTP